MSEKDIRIETLRENYIFMKKLSQQHAIEYLDGFVQYCKYIKFDLYKTQTMVGIAMDFLPAPGEKFTDCRLLDDFEIDFLKKLPATYFEK